MLYDILLTSLDLEVPYIIKHNARKLITQINPKKDSYRYYKKVGHLKDIIKNLTTGYNYYRYEFLGKEFIVGRGIIIECIDEKYKILLVITETSIYIDKDLLNDGYLKLYKQLNKEIFIPTLTTELDVVYTTNAGKYTFYIPSTPKFKTIGDRKDFVNNLVKDYYMNKQSNV